MHCNKQFKLSFEHVEDHFGMEMNHANAQDHILEAERNNEKMQSEQDSKELCVNVCLEQ